MENCLRLREKCSDSCLSHGQLLKLNIWNCLRLIQGTAKNSHGELLTLVWRLLRPTRGAIKSSHEEQSKLILRTCNTPMRNSVGLTWGTVKTYSGELLRLAWGTVKTLNGELFETCMGNC